MTSIQQYSTPDGSIWIQWRNQVTGDQNFDRIDSSDGSHEHDFRPQELDEVLRSWGPLSLHDPLKATADILHKAMEEAEVSSGVYSNAGLRLASWLDGNGYRLARKNED